MASPPTSILSSLGLAAPAAPAAPAAARPPRAPLGVGTPEMMNWAKGQQLAAGIYIRVLEAFAAAGAAMQYSEDLRPNNAYAILAPGSMGAGVALSNTGTLPEGNFIRGFDIHDGNSGLVQGTAGILMLASLQVNGWEAIRSGPVPLSVLAGYRTDQQRMRPLTGRKWRSAVPIFATVVNPTAATVFFGGLCAQCVNNECTPATSRSQPTYGFATLQDGVLWARALLRVLGFGGQSAPADQLAAVSRGDHLARPRRLL